MPIITAKSRATSEHELQLDRLLPLISQYADHGPFIDAIDGMYRNLESGDRARFTIFDHKWLAASTASDPGVRSYLSKIESIAKRFGLQRLPAMESHRSRIGYELIHNYYMNRRIADETGTPPSARSLVISAVGSSGAEHEIEKRDETIDLELDWDPVHESKSEALKRLSGTASPRINNWLNQQTSELTDRGIPFTESGLKDRDYRWLFNKLIGRSFYQIGITEKLSSPDSSFNREQIQRAVDRLADELEIDRRGW